LVERRNGGCIMVALLCYHKNLTKLYPKKWIDDYRSSILLQTVQDFFILEMNYGGGSERIFSNSIFQSEEMPTFVHALNDLLDICAGSECDAVFNSNVDDIYMRDWMQVQMPYMKDGYDVVGSNFSLKYEKPIIKPPKYHYFDKLNIKKELDKDHNVMGHPGISYSKSFIKENRYVPEEQPYEDMKLWQRTIDKYNFKIVPEHLFIHRIHDNAVCRSDNK